MYWVAREAVYRLRCKRGLSEVVTTLMLLVVAVLLAAVATYYATNITMTRTQIELVEISKEHVWVNSSGAIATFKVQNLGGRDILIDKLTTRGVEEKWDDIWVHRVPSSKSVTGDMNVTLPATLDSATETINGRNYTQQVIDIPLQSGCELLVYVLNPDNVQIDDIGTAVSVAIYTTNAQYIKEVNVESLTTQ
jgi:flagellin-like protein